MEGLSTILLTWLMTLIIASLVAIIMWRPLRIILSEMCETEQRSQFWAVYSTVMMILFPMFVVSLLGSTEVMASTLQRTLYLTLAGLGVAMLIIASQVGSHRPDQGNVGPGIRDQRGPVTKGLETP